ncbi:hypothetical protein HELRODRAFT_182181 [Helobdella robusta]|uniref:Apple domain-containing protein n=1 Tax=Helobdella robusta TaxID=6412 RepID=T1FHV9_HELRO|nr:hypothetical protein HELRODRAFT_182181 [Helobdella robusta]ESN91209.1 hypothetical protein HELRODRAFT_182181 [Helobdella robusta]
MFKFCLALLMAQHWTDAELYYDNFIVGLSKVQDPVVRNSYDVCEQIQIKTKSLRFQQVKCNASLPRYSMVIIQQPATGPGLLVLDEVEVFEPKNPESKLWLRFPNQRLEKTVTYNKSSSRAACVSECSVRNCYLVSYRNATQRCELFQTLKGMGEPYTLTTAAGWETWKVQYA